MPFDRLAEPKVGDWYIMADVIRVLYGWHTTGFMAPRAPKHLKRLKAATWTSARIAAEKLRANSRSFLRRLSFLGPRAPALGEFVLLARRDGVVMIELHRVAPLTAGESLEAQGIVGELSERHPRLQPGTLSR